jgi:hypothetical protein
MPEMRLRSWTTLFAISRRRRRRRRRNGGNTP